MRRLHVLLALLLTALLQLRPTGAVRTTVALTWRAQPQPQHNAVARRLKSHRRRGRGQHPTATIPLTALTVASGPLCSGARSLSTQEDVWALSRLGCGQESSALNLTVTGLVTSLVPLATLRELRSLSIDHCSFLTSLEGLSSLTNITGMLSIAENPALVSLQGLDGLADVYQVIIRNNPKLQSLAGLWSLGTIREDLWVRGNGIVSLEGLEKVSHFYGTVAILKNPKLRTLQGLHMAKTIDGDLEVKGNGALRDMRGLEALKYLGGTLKIMDNSNLLCLHGLGNLEEIGPGFSVRKNDQLVSLDGLDGLVSVWGPVEINKNKGLKSLQGLGNLARASTVRIEESGPMDVLGGPFAQAPKDGHIRALFFDEFSWPKCVTPQERSSLEGGGFVVGLSYAPSATVERWRGHHCGPAPQACTIGTPCSIDLNEANLTGVSRLFLSDAKRTCGACPEDKTAVISELGRAEFELLAEDMQPGEYSICRCMGGLVGDGPVGQLEINGPNHGHTFRCVRGSDCSLALEGRAVATADYVTLMEGCNGREVPGGRASKGEDRLYRFPNRSVLARALPKIYNLCWQPPCDAGWVGCKYVEVGTLELLGPFDVEEKVARFGQNLSLPNLGMGVASGDKLRVLRRCGQSISDGEADWNHEAESSMRLVFRFPSLNESIVRPGRNRLCWCRPNTTNCSTSADFLVDMGSLLALCPRNQQPSTDNLTCTPCPIGKLKVDPHREYCVKDAYWIFWFWVYVVSIYVMVLLPAFLLTGHIKVEDVSLEQGRTVITTIRPHGLHMYGKNSFCVTLSGTAHPELDNPKSCPHAHHSSATQSSPSTSPSWTSGSSSDDSNPSQCLGTKLPLLHFYSSVPPTGFRAREISSTQLELLSMDKQPIDRRLDTSMGTVTLTHCSRLRHTGWPLPATLCPFPLLMVALIITTGEVGFKWGFIGLLLALVLVPASFLVIVPVRRAFPQKTSLQRRLESFRMNLPKPRGVPRGPARAIQIGKLQDLLEYFDPFIRDRTAYYLDGNILRPLTKPKRLSYAELVGPSPVEWFVSHYWGTSFRHFCSSVRKHAESISGIRRNWREVAYWICFCSNNQYELEKEVGDSLWESSFYKTLQSGLCKGTCMVLDDDAKPFTRSWCIFELLQTLQLEQRDSHFGGLLLCCSGGVLNYGQGSAEVAMSLVRRVVDLDLAEAEASDPSDKELINCQVIADLGSFNALVRFVRRKMRLVLEGAQGQANGKFRQLFELIDMQEPESPKNQHRAAALRPFASQPAISFAPPAASSFGSSA